ncbi:MAG: DUF3187 family protein [Thermoanaerobaculia bacterium]
MRRSLFPFAAAGLLSMAAARAATGQPAVDPTPLAPRNTYLLALPFLHFGGLTGSPPAPGELRLRVEAIYSNTFSHTFRPDALKLELGTRGLPFTHAEAQMAHDWYGDEVIYFVDSEVLRTALTAELGLSRELSVAVEVPYLTFSAVSADGAILAFHRAFGLGQNERQDFPRGGFEVVLQAPYGPLAFDDRRPAAGFGDISATLKWRHPVGGTALLLTDVSVKAPTGSSDDFRGSGSADVGAMVGLSRTFGPQGWFLQGGIVIPGRWKGPLGLDASPFGRLLAGTSRLLGRRTVVSLSATLEGSPVSGYHLQAVSQPAVEIVVGARRALGTWGSADLTINEHIPRFGDGTDIGIRLGLTLHALP